MSITTIVVLVLIALVLVSAFVAYVMAQAAKQARRERDEFKAQSDRYLREIAAKAAELDRRQKLIDTIQEANREADENQNRIDHAGADPAGRFGAINSVLSDIAKRSGTGPDTKPGAR